MFEHGRQWGIYVKHTPNMRQLRLSSKIIVPFYSCRSFNNTEYISVYLCKNIGSCKNSPKTGLSVVRCCGGLDGVTG